jgi:hypothetical protein
MSKSTLEPWKRARLRRALERRYGQSMLVLKIEDWSESGVSIDKWRCEDLENGAWIIGRFDGDRLRVIAEGGPK